MASVAVALVVIGVAAVWYLRSIFLEVRSMRRMMNDDRRISNEVRQFD